MAVTGTGNDPLKQKAGYVPTISGTSLAILANLRRLPAHFELRAPLKIA
jgi:hypothetical protein